MPTVAIPLENGPRRVLHVITGLGLGGAEMMLANLAHGLRERGFVSHVLCLKREGPLADALAGAGVGVTSLELERGRRWPFALTRVAQLLLRFRPHLLQGWMYHGNLVASAIAGLRPVWWSVHNCPDVLLRRGARGRLLLEVGAVGSRAARGVVYVARTSQRQHEAVGFSRRRSLCVPLGFDLERFAPDARAAADVRFELGIERSAPVVSLFARVHPMKDHAAFISAAERLARGGDAATHFVLAGSGATPGNRGLEDRIAETGLGARFRLLGERRDVQRLAAASTLVALTSAWGEAFPSVLGEAMACATPVVTTDVGDAAELVGDRRWVVPAQDIGAIAERWRTLLSMSAAERATVGMALRQRIAERYSLASMCDRFARIYCGSVTTMLARTL